MKHFTIEELDAMTDEDFADLAYAGGDVALFVTPQQHDRFVAAHERYFSNPLNATRDVNWSVAMRSDWDLYAEIRMHGVPMEAAPAPAPQMRM